MNIFNPSPLYFQATQAAVNQTSSNVASLSVSGDANITGNLSVTGTLALRTVRRGATSLLATDNIIVTTAGALTLLAATNYVVGQIFHIFPPGAATALTITPNAADGINGGGTGTAFAASATPHFGWVLVCLASSGTGAWGLI